MNVFGFKRQLTSSETVTKRRGLVRGREGLKFAGENTIPNNLNQVKLRNLRLFTFEKLASATNNLNPENLLGRWFWSSR